MKKRIIICSILAVSLLITGCQSKEKVKNSTSTKITMSDSDDYIMEEDACHNFNEYASSIVPEEKGYYYIMNQKLCYYDKSIDKCVYVCSKVDCEHETGNQNCDANIDGFHNCMYHYKDNLYFIQTTSDQNGNFALEMVRVSEDGSERESLYSFLNYVGGEGLNYNNYIHRGYLYYTVNNEDAGKKEKATIYRRALEKDAVEEVYYETEGYGTRLDSFKAYGNELYFVENGFREADEQDAYFSLVKSNIHTKESSTIMDYFYGDYERVGENWYYLDLKTDKLICATEQGERTEVCDVETVFGTNCDTYLQTDGTNLYLYTVKTSEENEEIERSLKIIDTNGKELCVLNGVDEFIGADDEYLFFEKTVDEYSEEVGQEVCVDHMYYYKKSDIGSGDYSLRTEMIPE